MYSATGGALKKMVPRFVSTPGWLFLNFFSCLGLGSKVVPTSLLGALGQAHTHTHDTVGAASRRIVRVVGDGLVLDSFETRAGMVHLRRALDKHVLNTMRLRRRPGLCLCRVVCTRRGLGGAKSFACYDAPWALCK